MGDQQVLRGQFEELGKRGDRRTATVHERGGVEQMQLMVTHTGFGVET